MRHWIKEALKMEGNLVHGGATLCRIILSLPLIRRNKKRHNREGNPSEDGDHKRENDLT